MASRLLPRYSIIHEMTPALFVLVIFEIESHIFAWVCLDHNAPIYVFHQAGWQMCTTRPRFFCWNEVSWTVSMVCPHILILSISTSQVTRNTGVSHQLPAILVFWIGTFFYIHINYFTKFKNFMCAYSSFHIF
jgi:hypothetical protein